MKHELLFDADVEVPAGTAERLEAVITAALEAEGVEVPCEINVLLTDDEGIHTVNRETRGGFTMSVFVPKETIHCI